VRLEETIWAYGHHNIRAEHKTTWEITKDDYVTQKGNCIIGIRANKACADLNLEIKKAIQSGTKVKITLEIGGVKDEVTGYGHPMLKLTDLRSIVIRKSRYISPRTLMIMADKAATDLNRKLIQKLRENTRNPLKIIVAVEYQKPLSI